MRFAKEFDLYAVSGSPWMEASSVQSPALIALLNVSNCSVI